MNSCRPIKFVLLTPLLLLFTLTINAHTPSVNRSNRTDYFGQISVAEDIIEFDNNSQDHDKCFPLTVDIGLYSRKFKQAMTATNNFDTVGINSTDRAIASQVKENHLVASNRFVMDLLTDNHDYSRPSPLQSLNISLDFEPKVLAAIDINGDNIDDLVAGGNTNRSEFAYGDYNTIGIVISKGNGVFGPVEYFVGDYFVDIADVNNDGMQDIVTGRSIIWGSPSGRYHVGTKHYNFVQKREMVDFDGDGYLDLFNGGQSNWIEYGDDFGEFTRGTNRFLNSEAVMEDINGDTLVDLVVQEGYGSSSFRIYINLGDRIWSDPIVHSVTPLDVTKLRVYYFLLTDMTGDSFTDLIAVSDERIIMAEGIGDGTFLPGQEIAFTNHNGDGYLGGGHEDTGPCSSADFDQDNISDIVVCGYGGYSFWKEPYNAVYLVYGDSSAHFNRKVPIPVGGIHNDVTTGDFNGDGWSDIAVASVGSNSINILLNDNKGSFGNALCEGYCCVVADFDMDGNDDIVTNTGWIKYGDEYASFSDIKQIYDESSIKFVVSGFFDESAETPESDRRLDIAFFSYSNFRYRPCVILNQGNRTWSQKIESQETIRDVGDFIVVGDFNEDGCDDIIINNRLVVSQQTRLKFLSGHGDGTFTRISCAVPSSESFAADDLDVDGHLDLVIEGQIAWGRGSGEYDVIPEPKLHGGSISLVDINGDGLPDIVQKICTSTMVSYTYTYEVLINRGSRSFFEGVGIVDCAWSADVNGDGISDILTANNSLGILSTLFGDGYYGWSAPYTLNLGGRPEGDNLLVRMATQPMMPSAQTLKVGGDPARYFVLNAVGPWGSNAWILHNPWRDWKVIDVTGPRILEYVGPFNCGFATSPKEFVLTLSEPVDINTVSSNTVKVFSSGQDGFLGNEDDHPVKGTVEYNQETWKITFTPEVALTEGPYRFVASGEGLSAIRDLAGNELDGDVIHANNPVALKAVAIRPIPSGDGIAGGSFTSSFYVVDSIPSPQDIDGKNNDGRSSATPIIFNEDRRATISGEIYISLLLGDYDADYYSLGTLEAGEMITLDLDGLWGGMSLAGGAMVIYQKIAVGASRAFASACLTDGFMDSHLSFPIHYDGEYILGVNAYSDSIAKTRYQERGSYSIDIAIDRPPTRLQPRSQLVYLDFDGDLNSSWGKVYPFEADHIWLESAETNILINHTVEAVRRDFSEITNVSITTEQPESAEYSRVVIGSAAVLVDPETDTWNLNRSDIALVNTNLFLSLRHRFNLDTATQALANVISHQIGHLLGLQHVKDNRRIMGDIYPNLSLIDSDRTFGPGTCWWADSRIKINSPDILKYNTGM